ncbi:MAG TPA: hypothetical protein VGB19_16060 [Actinomycetota bacterium]
MNEGVSTVHLGQYSRESANLIVAELEERGIVWWYKEPGFLAQVWERGVRLFVDKSHLAEAREIAERVVTEREREGWPPLE